MDIMFLNKILERSLAIRAYCVWAADSVCGSLSSHCRQKRQLLSLCSLYRLSINIPDSIFEFVASRVSWSKPASAAREPFVG